MLLEKYLFFLFLSDASPFSCYWQNSYSRRDEISFGKIELNQSSTAAGINQRQLACFALVSSCFFAYSPPLVPLSSWLDAIVHPRRVCSWQRVITIAGQHEPTAESPSATRGSFNIDNNPRASSLRFSLSLSLFYNPFFVSSFLACHRVIPLLLCLLITIDARCLTKNSSRFHAGLATSTRCFQ